MQIDDRISVYWTMEKKHFEGTVTGSVDEDGVLLHRIEYDAEETKYHDMSTEQWVKIDGEGFAQAEASVKAVIAQTQASQHARNAKLTMHRLADKQAMIAAMYTMAWASEYGDNLAAME